MDLIKKFGIDKCKRIVDGAPKGWQWALISNQGQIVYFKDCVFGLAYHKEGTCWISANPDVREHLIGKKYFSDILADHDRIDTCSDIRNHISPNTKVIDR